MRIQWKKQSKNRRWHEILSNFLSFGAKFNQEKISDSIIVATENSWYLFFPQKKSQRLRESKWKKSV